MRKQFDNQKTLTGHDNDAVYFRDDSSSCGSSRENIRLGPFLDFGSDSECLEPVRRRTVRDEDDFYTPRNFREKLSSLGSLGAEKYRRPVSIELSKFLDENELDKEFPRVNSQVPLSPRGDEDDRSYQYSEAEAERGTWTGKFDFLLSLLGYSVGLGNVWRFPYLCYSNGGGAFLIPFICMMLLAGLPLMFMELSFGQYASLGPISIFEKFCPLFSGLGYGMVIVSGTVMLYYNMIIAWTIFYMFVSWNSRLPWDHCSPEWSTPMLISWFKSMKYLSVSVILTICGQAFAGGYSGYFQSSKDGNQEPRKLIILTGDQPVPQYLLNSPFTILPVPGDRLNRGKVRRLDRVIATVDGNLVNSQTDASTSTDSSMDLTSMPVTKVPALRRPNKLKRRRFKNGGPKRNYERYLRRVESEDETVPLKLQRQVQSFQSKRNESILITKSKEATSERVTLRKLSIPQISSAEILMSKQNPSTSGPGRELAVKIPTSKVYQSPTVSIKRFPSQKKYPPTIPVPTRKVVPVNIPRKVYSLPAVLVKNELVSKQMYSSTLAPESKSVPFNKPVRKVYQPSTISGKGLVPQLKYPSTIPVPTRKVVPLDIPLYQFPATLVKNGLVSKYINSFTPIPESKPVPVNKPTRKVNQPSAVTVKGLVSQKKYPSSIPIPGKKSVPVDIPRDDVYQFPSVFVKNELVSERYPSSTPSLGSKAVPLDIPTSEVYQFSNSNRKPGSFGANTDIEPYSFGYGVFDGLGTSQYRQESATGDGVVRGNYGYEDFQGLYRRVEYTADDSGFHAVLKSNEPGLGNVESADVSLIVESPPPSVLINA